MGAHESVVDDGGVVRIGSVLFALIKPTPGHEVAFNHWYERDHYYTTGTAAPGVFSAGRFVHPESRWHLALYFVLPGFDAARLAFATEQVEAAAAEGRMFSEREHLHTWVYDVESTAVGSDGVPLALALDHRYAALSVVMADIDLPDIDLPDIDLPDTVGPSMILRPRSQVMPSAWEGRVDPGRRRTVVTFGETRPQPAPNAVWSGAFVPVVFGTDIHVAE